jgi:RNA polymerase sigma-70 factor (sigma-E family)
VDEASEREFREYVVRRRGVLEREAYLLVGDVHLAQDLVQTALAKAYVSWQRVRSSENADAYVRRILVNANISWLRKRRVREFLTDLAVETKDAYVAGPAGTDTTRVDIVRALMALPKRQRTAVVLRYWADLPEAEVAAVMGCSVGTVRSQSAKALTKLRGQLSDALITHEGGLHRHVPAR